MRLNLCLKNTDDDMDLSVINTYIKDIKSASEQGRLVVFVGAGVSNNSGVPIWSKLIDGMKADLPEFAKTISDDLKLAQIYKTTYPTKFVDKVKSVLRHGMVMPNPVHDAILDLKPAHIITTNYDDLLEQACSKRYEQYSVICSDEDLPSSKSSKLLIKMHGDFEKGNIVLAEQDYYDYSRNFPLIRSYVMSLFASKTILFVGFSFDDINLKYILRELKTILQKKMQPVYLLTGNDMGHEQLHYLEDQGISPLCVLPQMLEDSEKNFPKPLGGIPVVLTNNRGKLLYRQLRLIKNFRESKDPFIEVIDSLARYDDEFGMYGGYLRYIAPEYLQSSWHQRYNELDIEAEWFDKFCKADKSKKDILTLCRAYGECLPKAFEIALKNHVYYLGRGYKCGIFSNGRYKRLAKKLECDGVNDFYRMKLIDVYDRIAELSDQSVTLTRKDLELPYLYYKTGKYEEAFGRYFVLAETFWRKKRFILYMICRINMRALANTLIHSNKTSSDIKNKASEICHTELADILDILPIDNGVRKIFLDIISYKMLLVRVESTAKICRNIEKQREDANKGGVSWNNYAQELLYDFSSLVDFCNVNYIISDSFEYARKAFCNIAKGLMSSLMIQDGEFNNSHLKAIRMEMLLLFLFHLRKDELLNILNVSTTHEISIDDEARGYIVSLVSNLLEYTHSDFRRQNKFYDEGIVSDIVFNLSVLLCFLPKDCMPENDLYLLIAEYMRICDERDYTKVLELLFDKRGPSTEEAEKVMNIYVKHSSKATENPWLLSQLAKVLAEVGKTLDVDENFTTCKNLSVISLAAIRPVVPDERREELDSYIRNNIKDLYEALVIELNSDCHVLDKQMFSRLLDDFASKPASEDDVYTCHQLKMFYQNDSYIQYRPLIEPAIQKKKPLAFFLDPIANVADMDVHWILWLEDALIRELINQNGVMPKIDAFCKTAYEHIGKLLKQRIWKALVSKNE